jgi:acylphosphatase
MKPVLVFFISLLTVLSVLAQHNISTVTITVNGNKSLQVSVDGRDYNLYNSTVIGNKTTIGINDLESGQHTLQVIRTDQNTNRSENISTIFNLRRRYDMLVKVNVNGSLELIEKMRARTSANKPAMSYADYNSLLNTVKYQRTANGRRTIIANAFNTTNNYFSCSQVVQLLQQVNTETYRLELAKLSYRTITDRDNFNLVYDLLNKQISKDELDTFVNSYYEDSDNSNINVAMSDASFTSLLETIQQQWPVSTQMNSLINAFNNNTNYFTTYQASQLIQIVSAENNRLKLAKLSYRSITDRDNFNQVYDLLNSQASRNELENYVNNYYEGSNPAISMTDANYNSLYQTIRQQWPVSTQMNSLTSAFNNTSNYFTTSQAGKLIQLVSSESNRLQLAKLSYRSVTDLANFSQIYNLLSTQASKNTLAAYVNNYSNGGVDYKVAMSDADFNTIYQNIQLQFLPGGKMTAITNAFNNTSYFFTCTQAKKLIELVSLESNRLQLAKLSYRSITDRGNFSQLYDLLESQASKDELEAYVQAYRD